MTMNLSLFYVVWRYPAHRIVQYTYARPSYEETFYSNSTRFRLQGEIAIPGAGIDSNNPIVSIVNRKGANGTGGLDLFVRTAPGAVAWISSDDGGNTWGPSWTALPTTLPVPGVTIASSPVASAYALDRIIVVVRGSDNKLYRGTITPNALGVREFNEWINTPELGAPTGKTLVGEPTVIGFPINGYRVYARTQDSGLWSRTFDGTSLGNWTQVTDGSNNIWTNASPEGVGVAFTEPGAAQLGDQEEGLNVFYRAGDNSMRLVRMEPTGLIGNANLGGVLTSPAGAAYFRDLITAPSPLAGSVYHELHTFGIGADGLIYGRYVTLDVGMGTLTPSANWYSFSTATHGRASGKPDAVAWEGDPIFQP